MIRSLAIPVFSGNCTLCRRWTEDGVMVERRDPAFPNSVWDMICPECDEMPVPIIVEAEDE